MAHRLLPLPLPLNLRRLLPIAAAALALTACAGTSDDDNAPAESSADFPMTVQNCEREVTLDASPERAVAINQPATELLLSLGLEDQMVAYGVSDHDFLSGLNERAKDVKALDAEFSSFESVLDLEPDFIYATFAYTFTAEGIASHQKFNDLGIATYQSPSECGGQDAEQKDALTLDDMYDEIGEISRMFGVEDRGDDLVTELKDRAEKASVDLDAKDVTLGWWYASTKAPYMAGCCGAPGLMTRAVGATNAFDESKQLWPETTWESILDADPTVLVLADLDRGGDGDSAKDKIKFLESDPVASKLTAVKEKRYIILDGTTMDPSIRNVDGIENLAKGLQDLGVVS